ncbi:hypothetical protein MKW92_045545 [Papaver armeniacum]|nr:hypothetical protein MKW92_045545 [Papaver armeniacum]
MGGDARNWDEESYRKSILKEREIQSRTVFRTVFAPSSQNPEYIVVASSDGSVAPYSISSCISNHHLWFSKSGNQMNMCASSSVAEPFCLLKGHNGPAYDVKFFGDGDDSLLLSCGDDGRIQGWRWNTILNSGCHAQETDLKPVLDLVNPQHKGPWGSLSPIPENNAIAIDYQGGSIFSAAGDSCAYCWDVETSKIKMVFRGHTDYLHCIVARNSSNQIITGSEDGSMRIWDCRNGKCVNIIEPKQIKSKEAFPWISCIGLDSSESWLILAVGAEPLLSRFDLNGMTLSQIQCAPQSAFSISLHPSGYFPLPQYFPLLRLLVHLGLLDEIGRQCLIRVPFDQFPTLTSVSRKWKQEVESKEFLQERKTSGFNQSLIGLIQTHPINFLTPKKSTASTAAAYRLCLFEPGKSQLKELPPIPGCEDGLPRFCHCAGVGRKIVVIGGWNTKTWELLNSVYIYDLITGMWRRGVDMPGGKRSSFACASDLDCMVYIAGGHDQEKNTLRSALAYDVLGDVWFSLPDMARPRDESKGLLSAGKFHVIGGYETEMQGDFDKSAEIFDVNTWKWDWDEKDILETDVCHKTCVFDHQGNLYKCDSDIWHACMVPRGID